MHMFNSMRYAMLGLLIVALWESECEAIASEVHATQVVDEQHQAPMDREAVSVEEEKTVQVYAAALLFPFDQADLGKLAPAEQKRLNALVGDLRKLGDRAQRLEIQAYTDRLGSWDYNRSLSLRRAENVRAYFVSRGIWVNDVGVAGLGPMDPVSRQCPEDLLRDQLVDCLAEDRRVKVLVWTDACDIGCQALEVYSGNEKRRE